MELGTLVSTILLSMLTVTPAVPGTVVLVTEVTPPKVFGCQPSRKKPMVLATEGSTCGLITGGSGVGSGSGTTIPPPLFLSQPISTLTKKNVSKLKNIFIIYNLKKILILSSYLHRTRILPKPPLTAIFGFNKILIIFFRFLI
jgi:hypothetical protein